jgi:hypothetical protein
MAAIRVKGHDLEPKTGGASLGAATRERSAPSGTR